MCACVHAHSPLARLLLSMYIAQQNTNPVIKKNVGAGRVRLSRSTAGEETGSLHSHTDSRTHRLTHTHARARQTERNDSEPHGPAVRSRATVCSSRDGCGGDTRSVWSRGLPGVCERQAAAEREQGGGSDGGGGMEEQSGEEGSSGEVCERGGFHDNKLR